ncbi:hypothetical protein C483_00070 [Natrialba hulunbeirensis JCM 10989]|uniref:Uncharacterized protein n=1 Tax=Natrialba hulunbeirensis JCM 10989 TaxID=1227493 RepID=M0ACA6_9EURY|nr:hypothetical protein C483_00070 [Natrialba hulunbeirensis JCM 10989]
MKKPIQKKRVNQRICLEDTTFHHVTMNSTMRRSMHHLMRVNTTIHQGIALPDQNMTESMWKSDIKRISRTTS